VAKNWLIDRETSPFHSGFDLPKCVNWFRGELMIIGTGRCVMDDLDRYEPKGDVLVIKQMGLFYPKFRHWWLSDTKDYPNWLKTVRETGRARDMRIPFHTHSNAGFQEGIDFRWQFNPRHARSAGLESTIIGLAMGYDSIVLAGCPADNSGHFYPDARFVPGALRIDYGDREHKDAWMLIKDLSNGRVKSLSGNTREWLGEPII